MLYNRIVNKTLVFVNRCVSVGRSTKMECQNTSLTPMLRFEVKTTKHKDVQWRQNLPAALCELTKNEVKVRLRVAGRKNSCPYTIVVSII